MFFLANAYAPFAVNIVAPVKVLTVASTVWNVTLFSRDEISFGSTLRAAMMFSSRVICISLR